MAATYRTARLDAWDSASTPSPRTYRSERRGTHAARRDRVRPDSWRPDYGNSPEWMGSVVRMSEARAARRASVEPRRTYGNVTEAPPIQDYDWEAAARRRPRANECERVILHADRSIEARMGSARFYGREATARRPDPWPEAPRRQSAPRAQLVKRRTPAWRLRLLVGFFAALAVGLVVVAPIVTSAAVAGLESAVGQAEAQQEQLAADAAALSSQISSLSSPQRVAEQAAQLGLVPADDVSYLSTGDQLLASEGDTTVADR